MRAMLCPDHVQKGRWSIITVMLSYVVRYSHCVKFILKSLCWLKLVVLKYLGNCIFVLGVIANDCNILHDGVKGSPDGLLVNRHARLIGNGRCQLLNAHPCWLACHIPDMHSQ